MKNVKTNKRRVATKLRFGNTEERAKAARSLVAKRYAKMTPKDWEAFRKAMSEQATGRPRNEAVPRCKCKRMTLKRARARGREEAHAPDCDFYPA